MLRNALKNALKKIPFIYSTAKFIYLPLVSIRNIVIVVHEDFVYLLKVLALSPLMLFKKRKGEVVCIALRNNYIGPCVVDLLVRAKENKVDVCFLVDEVGAAKKVNQKYLNEISYYDYVYANVGSWKSAQLLLISKSLIVFEHVPEINSASFLKNFYRPNFKIGRVPDGILTKTTASIIPGGSNIKPTFRMRFRSYSSKVDYVVQPGVDGLRVAIHTGVRSATFLKRVGLPRINRSLKLKSGDLIPLAPDSLKEKLKKSGDGKKVFLALTKSRDSSSDLKNLCSQLSVQEEELISLLESKNISLWIKEHQRTNDWRVGFPDMATSTNVFYLSQEESLSAIDVGKFMDAVITDISSVYVDLLPLDIPIGFVAFDYWKSQGSLLYPDCPFYPGHKLNYMSALVQFFDDLSVNKDDWVQDRENARKVLLGNRGAEVDNRYWQSYFS